MVVYDETNIFACLRQTLERTNLHIHRSLPITSTFRRTFPSESDNQTAGRRAHWLAKISRLLIKPVKRIRFVRSDPHHHTIAEQHFDPDPQPDT